MRLAAIIGEESGLPFLEAIRDDESMQLCAVWTPDSSLRELIRAIAPQAEFPEHWDQLLVASGLDGVIIAGTSEEILSAARQLLQVNFPLLIVTDTAAGPAKIFEFLPLWQEHPELVVPLFTSGLQRVSQEVLQQFTAAEKGDLWKLEFTRVLDCESIGDSGLTSAEIDHAFFQDAQWICELTGAPRHVTMQLSGPADHPVEATILLGGEHTPEIRWTLRSQPRGSQWELKLIGSSGQVVTSCGDDHLPVIEIDGLSRPLPINNTRTEDAAEQLRTELSKSATGKVGRTWTDVVQIAEVGAAARRSLARRRTIEIHFEEVSERSQFKSQMTAIGCGALLWTMFGMVCLLTLAGLLDPRDREYRSSATAGFVLRDHDFVPGKSELTPTGQRQIESVLRKWSSSSPVLIIERDANVEEELNQQRQSVVLRSLREAEIRDPELLTVLRPLNGKWFETGMILAWIVVFAPLGIVLGMQLLILATQGTVQDISYRPGERGTSVP